MNQKIKHLDENLIRQIAAGEVIDRPASVVKELIENSLDANATKIQIDIRNGGQQYIQVADNGTGINKSDLIVAADRHSTSKISKEADLENILSLGFRGEFLASLVAVANVQILSREQNSEEAYLADYATLPPKVQLSARAPGTTVTMKNLFVNVPARRKFLGKPRTDASHIHEIIRQFALAWPSILFSLIVDNKEIFRSQPGSPENAMSKVIGRETTKNMLKFQGESDNWKVSGFIGKPSEVRGTRSQQYFILNKRIIISDLIRKGLEDGYGNYLARRRYPVATLYLTAETSEFDPNVHPAKKEIRIKREQLVYNLIKESVEKTLHKLTPVFSNTDQQVLHQKTLESELTQKASIHQNSSQQSTISNDIKPTSLPVTDKLHQVPEKSKSITSESKFDFDEEEEQLLDDNDPLTHIYNLDKTRRKGGRGVFEHVTDHNEIENLEPLFQYRQLYIIAQNEKNPEDALYIIDQHAVAERITLEHLLDNPNRFHRQQLLEPILIELTPIEYDVSLSALPHLHRLGYRIDDHCGTTLAIRSIPIFFGRKIDQVRILTNIRGLINELVSGQTRQSKHSTEEEEITKSIACHGSIRSGEHLTHQEMKDLLKKMKKSKYPFVCCHGRPSILKIKSNNLDHLFWR
ncbi:MAG: DNA mismatch repair endonuclease MutL [Candidatus Hodarchaeales archaeon]|jgi:DNA mismatch repair protein MutL